MKFRSPDIQGNFHNPTPYLKSAQSSQTSEEKETNSFKGQPVPMAELVPGGSGGEALGFGHGRMACPTIPGRQLTFENHLLQGNVLKQLVVLLVVFTQ